jgi:hypothetical protein
MAGGGLSASVHEKREESQHTNNRSTIGNLEGRSFVDDSLNIGDPSFVPIRRVGSERACDFGSDPVGNPTCTRLGVDILQRGSVILCVWVTTKGSDEPVLKKGISYILR